MRFKHTVFTIALFLCLGSPARAIETQFEEDAAIPVVNLNIAVKTGTVSDPQGQSGISNFMGEMLMRGTRSMTKEQIDFALDQMGAQLSVETRAESLIMRGAVLSSQLEPFLKLLQELITQSTFPEHEIRKLKSEIVSSLLEELGRDPSLGARKFNEFLFNGHPYGKPILGKVKDIEHLTREQIVSHYDRLFRDKQLLVIGTGQAPAARIKVWADSLGKARPGGQAFVKVGPPSIPAKTRLLIVDKPERTQTQINAGQLGVRMTDTDFFPLYLGNHAFGGGSFSARMMVEIRVKRGWSYGATSHFRHGLQPRSWQFHLFPAAKDTAPALALSLQMVRDLKEKGITPEEFDFAKRSLVNSAGFMYDTSKKRVENALIEKTLDLPEGFMKSYGPRLESVTLDQVNGSLKRFLKPDQTAIVVVGTAKDLKEPLAKAAGIPVDQVQVVPYTQE